MTQTNPSDRTLPVLSESSLLRYVAFTALYMAQGLPAGLMAIAIPAWLAAQGMGTAEIGMYLGVIGLPWSLKLVAGPIMDRFTFLPMGRRRPWVLSAQLGMVFTFWIMALLTDPVQNLYWLAGIGFFINIFTAFQDVAVDGLAIDVLPSHQQAQVNGFMWGGKIIGFAATAAGGSHLLNTYGFSAAFLIISLGIALIFIIPILFKERQGERTLPWTDGTSSQQSLQLQATSWRDIWRNLFASVRMPMSRLAALGFFGYTITEGITNAIFPVFFVQELGWADTEYSELTGTTRLVAGLLGILLGALVVGKLGRIRTILISGVLLVISYIAIGTIDHLWESRTVITAFIFAKDILGVTITVAYLATCMDLCWQRVAASQFSLFMALANLGNSVGEVLTGPLDSLLNYTQLFFVISAILLVALIFFYYINLNTHKEHINELEAKLA